MARAWLTLRAVMAEQPPSWMDTRRAKEPYFLATLPTLAVRMRTTGASSPGAAGPSLTSVCSDSL